MADLDRYRSKFVVLGPDDCWPWTAATDAKGYGLFWDGTFRSPDRPRMVRAHRWGYTVIVGNPRKKLVRHRCDNPPCQNPRHWILGTHVQNMGDMVERGWSLIGETNPEARLNELLVCEIRARYADHPRPRQVDLAVEYNISQSQISRILRGESWTYIKSDHQ